MGVVTFLVTKNTLCSTTRSSRPCQNNQICVGLCNGGRNKGNLHERPTPCGTQADSRRRGTHTATRPCAVRTDGESADGTLTGTTRQKRTNQVCRREVKLDQSLVQWAPGKADLADCPAESRTASFITAKFDPLSFSSKVNAPQLHNRVDVVLAPAQLSPRKNSVPSPLDSFLSQGIGVDVHH